LICQLRRCEHRMCGPCCPGKPDVRQLKVGAESVGISGFDEIMALGLDHVEESDEEQRKFLLVELKKRNYVPKSKEQEYLAALWAEFKKLRAKKKGWLDDSYHGIPREEIQWFPTIDYEKCTGCQACFKFCHHEVFTFDDRPRVTNPYRCVVTCTGCKAECKEGAISFPRLTDLREELKVLKKKHKITDG
jgi:NAD-dependent dihydropyrimidine dehydrogenase PreA subunit